MKKRDQAILQGVLSGTHGMCLSYKDGRWILFSNSDEIEVVCEHPEWSSFIELCNEYSDYVEGD